MKEEINTSADNLEKLIFKPDSRSAGSLFLSNINTSLSSEVLWVGAINSTTNHDFKPSYSKSPSFVLVLVFKKIVQVARRLYRIAKEYFVKISQSLYRKTSPRILLN